jgi:predicted RNase H-like HicB family nuclease
MQNNYTAVIKQSDNYWIGWIKEIPGVNCQELTREAIIETLRITLAEAIELNKEEALSEIGENYHEELIMI